MGDEGQVAIKSESDIVAVRKTVRNEAIRLGFGITDATRIVTAASELARNIVLYAGSGIMGWRTLDVPEGTGIELTFSDDGPGISDVELAMQSGYSTSGGLGLGLPGAKRLMDDLQVSTEVGKGTAITVRKWLRRGVLSSSPHNNGLR